MRLRRTDLRPKKVDFLSERADCRAERVDVCLLGLISSLIEPDLGLWRDILIDRQTDRCKEIQPCVLCPTL